MKAIILWTYEVQEFALVVPPWMNEASQPRYDIDAKAADSVPDAQVKLMLQALLAHRFKLSLSRQSQEDVRWVMGDARG